MNIVVLEGSPNKHGSSNMLADEFIRGAREAGHTVKVIDAAHADLHPCTGCTGKHMKSALLSAAWNADSWTFEALEAHYKTLVRYLNFDNQGMILGKGCGSPAMTKRSKYMKKAYELGKSLR